MNVTFYSRCKTNFYFKSFSFNCVYVDSSISSKILSLSSRGVGHVFALKSNSWINKSRSAAFFNFHSRTNNLFQISFTAFVKIATLLNIFNTYRRARQRRFGLLALISRPQAYVHSSFQMLELDQISTLPHL